MNEYVKWEPVVGQVPPDGCEFILKKYESDAVWLVWADSDNREIRDSDWVFSFRIPAPTKENPVVIKYFTFEERPEAAKEFKTLADVPEGVRCVVTGNYSSVQTIRLRKGGSGINTEGYHIDYASQYHIIQILDPLPEPQLPATMAEAEECRVYIASDGRHYFKADAWLFVFTQVSQDNDGYFHVPRLRTSDTYAMNAVRIIAATNTYAVPCSQEVK